MAYTADEAKELVVEAGRRLVREGLIARTWGNISARISADEFVITPSGRAYEDLTPADIVTVKVADASWEGSIKPSSEKGVHAAVYRVRDDVDFVIHTHQTMATAYGTLGISLSDYGEEWHVLGDFVPCGTYAISSTAPLARNMEEVVRDCPDSNAFFMRYHGALVVGATYEDAFAAAETLERVCTREVVGALADYGIDYTPGAAEKVLADPWLTPTIDLAGRTALFVQTPAVVEASKSGRPLRPIIDDLAQIAGPVIPSVDYTDGWDKRATVALIATGSSAVLLRGIGALCVGANEDEAQAVAMVLEKDCVAQLFMEAKGQAHRLSFPDALVQRAVYVAKYSKLKG